MTINKKDLIFIVALGVILIFLLFRSGSEKARPLPTDAEHSQFIEQMAAGKSRIDVEKGCLDCHNRQARPLPKGHPPKEQCLICHTK